MSPASKSSTRLGVISVPRRSQVALRGKNLTDQDYFNAAFSTATTFGSLACFYNPPLTFGGELS